MIKKDNVVVELKLKQNYLCKRVGTAPPFKYSDVFLIKNVSSGGYAYLGEGIRFPLQHAGKRVRFKVEFLEDSEIV